MNIVLAAINAKYIHSNLAVYSLKSYAHEYKDDISIVEYTINQQVDDILMDLFKQKADVICFSCYIWNLKFVEAIVRELSKILPHVSIWLGGPEVSYDAKDVMERLPEIEGVMFGEGEETFLELVRYYKREILKLESITGIAYRSEKGEIKVQKWRPVLDLSTVPFVYRDMQVFQHKIIYYETSRGCPFSCSYCLSSIDKCLRFRDLDLVKEELQFFIDQRVPQVKFVDRTFNCNHKHSMAIWRYLLDHDNGITNFHFEIAADLLTDEELDLMSQMRPGLIQLEIGVQSTNVKTVKEIRRTMDFQKVQTIVSKVKKMKNIHQHLDLIAGLPFEDYQSFQTSFNEVYALHPEQLQLGFLKVLKGSYMEEQKEVYGLVYKEMPPYEVLFTNWLSYEEVMKLKQVEEMVELYYNSGQFEVSIQALEKEFSSPFELYEQLGDYYEMHDLHLINHSRVARYEILFDFICKYQPEKMEYYKELLTYDLYLRENLKNRPLFIEENQADKNIVTEFYEREAREHEVLVGYEQYDKRQMRKMTHIEKFHYHVQGNGASKMCYIVFDYQNRNPLTNQASTYMWEV